jgi:hypothetical protein
LADDARIRCKTAAVLDLAAYAGAKDRLRHMMEEKFNA